MRKLRRADHKDHKKLRNARAPRITVPETGSWPWRPSRGLALGAAGFTGAALLLAARAASRSAAKQFITPAPVEKLFLTPWELGISYEDVNFQTSDGLGISGWWMERPDARRTIIALAGHNSARQHVLGIGSALYREGANVLLFDNRGRGSSEGDLISLGHYERLDAAAAVEYALGRAPDLPLGMIGYSMGGSVALMSAAEDRRIEAVVADSPFASQTALVTHHLRERVGPFAPAVFTLAKGALHYDIHAVEPVRDVEKISPRPVFFIHGSLDEVTSPEDSVSMYARAGEPKDIWLVEDAAHVESYFKDRVRYCSRIAAFFQKHLS